MPLPDIVAVPRTDPIYNAHGYLTKVPVGAIRPFIEEFSEPGDLVVDCFAGSGMTAVACMMSGRRAEVSDISVLGQHVGRGFLSEVAPAALACHSAAILARVREEAGHVYRTLRQADGSLVEWNRTIWSYVFRCPDCGEDMTFYAEVAGTGESSPKACPACGLRFRKRDWECVDDVPVAVVHAGCDGKLAEQAIARCDLDAIDRAARDPRQRDVPSLDIEPDREMFRRSALGRWGLTDTRSFFTDRNALMLLLLWGEIGAVEDEAIRQKLMFAFTAILPRASRRYQWGPKRPLNAQNQTYYISPVHFEWNVLDLFERKVRAALRAQEYRNSETTSKVRYALGSGVDYRVTSATRLAHLGDDTVDYVFTDPPFGSNIFYSDMNLFQEAWLGSVTETEHEAVIQTGGRGRAGAAERYERILEGAFREAHRVLRPGAHMSVVFGNSKGPVWGMVLRALKAAGFGPAPVHLALLDKGQRSVKGLASGREGVVTVDLVLTVQKHPNAQRRADPQLPFPTHREELIRRAVRSLPPEKRDDPSYIYVATIKDAISRRRAVDDLHLSDVLVAIASRGYEVDPKSGLYTTRVAPERFSHKQP